MKLTVRLYVCFQNNSSISTDYAFGHHHLIGVLDHSCTSKSRFILPQNSIAVRMLQTTNQHIRRQPINTQIDNQLAHRQTTNQHTDRQPISTDRQPISTHIDNQSAHRQATNQHTDRQSISTDRQPISTDRQPINSIFPLKTDHALQLQTVSPQPPQRSTRAGRG